MTEPEVVQKVEPMRVYKAAELREGWEVRPVRGYSLSWTLQAPWWTHIVEKVENGMVYLARPYGMLHYGTALLGCEQYAIELTSTMQFVRLVS